MKDFNFWHWFSDLVPILCCYKTIDSGVTLAGGGASEASQFRSEMAQNGNILNHTPVFLCFSVGSRFIGVERGQDESMNDALLSLAHNMPAHVQT